MDLLIVKQIGIALIIGLMVGLQREMRYQQTEKKSFAGTRTFALIALFGYLSAWLQTLVPMFLLVAFALFGLLILVSYVKNNSSGSTTEMAAILTFALGAMLYFSLEVYVVLLAVAMLFLLGIKRDIARLKDHITSDDLNNATLFLMMTFIVLPLLPDKTIDVFNIFNPYKTWLMVVLIAGISFVGYIATKLLGNQKGIFITALFGGLASSTAVSIMFSKRYAIEKRFVNTFAMGIAIASTMMYARVLLETFFFNPSLMHRLIIPLLGATLVGILFIIYLYSQTTPLAIETEPPSKNPLALHEALKLGVLFGVIFGAIGVLQAKFGDSGIYLVSFLAGVTDVDAITLSLSQLALSVIKQEIAMHGILLAVGVNSLVKLGIVFFLGGWKLGATMGIFYLLSLGVMAGSLIFEAAY